MVLKLDVHIKPEGFGVWRYGMRVQPFRYRPLPLRPHHTYARVWGLRFEGRSYGKQVQRIGPILEIVT